jgi:DNA-binding GntR family transcriptional regulator
MIAGELGISRTPVRDALRRLQSEGLVDIVPNYGARVASWTEVELGEISRMRVMLEGFACELAAAKIRPAEIGELRRHSEVMAAAAGPDGDADLDQISRSNLDFHRVIAEAAHNTRLQSAIEPLWHFPLVIRKFALFSPDHIQRSLLHHREIITALTEGNPDWAGAIMRAHIESARPYDSMLTQH